MRGLRCTTMAVILLCLVACNSPSSFPTTTIASGGYYTAPVWSESGDRLVVFHSTQSEERVEVLSVDGGLQQSTQTAGLIAGNTAWIGSEVVFLGDAPGGSRAVYRIENGSPRPFQSIDRGVSISWTRDGKLSAIATSELMGGKNETNLYLIDSLTGSRKPIWTRGGVRAAKISPAGRYVAYTHKEADSFVLSLFEVSSGKIRDMWVVPWPGDGFADLMWSPGEELLGVQRSGGDDAAGYYLLPLKEGAQPILFTKEQLVDPDWSPTGDRVVYGTVGSPGQNKLQVLQLPSDWKQKFGAQDVGPGETQVDPAELEPSHWRSPVGSSLRIFLGTSLVTADVDRGVLQAVDQAGTRLWSTRLPGSIYDVVKRSDLTEGLALTTAGSFWIDLRTGEIIGPGSFAEPAMGEYIWRDDWLLAGIYMFNPPVDPKSPGRHGEHAVWTLYRAQRSKRAWEKTGQLTNNGLTYATVSDDGRVALVGAKDEPGLRVYQDGQVVRTIVPRGKDSRLMLTKSGKYVVDRYSGGMTINSVDGRSLVEVRHSGNGLTVWGDRLILSTEAEFSAYDTAGQELFHRSGTVPRQQFNGKYLLAGEGTESGLFDATGRMVASIPRSIETLEMTPDGKWVYCSTPDGLDAFPIPR